MANLSRRDFLKYSIGGMAVLVIGSRLSWLANNPAYAATQTVSLRIGDAIKQMHTHNALNNAECYFWMYKSVEPDLPHDCPGPVIIATKGDTINISVENSLDEPHAFAIPDIGFTSGAIQPGDTFSGVIDLAAAPAGAYLYYDNLNEPVNRIMGLHGALIVMPAAPSGARWTPYDTVTPAVQQLFDDFGSTDHFPGLAWEEGDSTSWALNDAFPEHGVLNQPNCPPFRQYVWLAHQASPKLFMEVGNSAPGDPIRNPTNFMNAFLRDPFTPHAFHADNPGGNRIAQYFTFSGQSGFFAHDSPVITPMGRVGEPCVVHILNAGLWTHSMHLHANHFYVTSVNGVVRDNVFSLDTFEVGPMDRVDYVLPFNRPPDVPNVRGIGRPDEPLVSPSSGQPVWPPIEEMNAFLPAAGTTAPGSGVELGQRLSPLCFPMHDHSEPSQTSQGGNYNTGLISGMYFTGDRNTPGHFDFEMEEDFHMMFKNVRGVTVIPPATLPAAPPHNELP
ncbi:MAG: multicopper oxidase domain-containing protein [Dehalococcoidales bacterium]|nr:multicopper oxidase domain-containing protein [Dehalococcoidales bacterium]MDZ4230548.1 multicopper oxidase domain-containing protein [Dehalococcoidales bacterium]